MIGSLTVREVKFRVPIEFPMDTSLSYSARIVALTIQVGLRLKYDTKELVAPTYLAGQTSKKEKTIAKAIAELEASQWDYDQPFKIKKGGKAITISSLLILDKELTNCAKLLYCFLLILQVLSNGILDTRFSELHKMFGLGVNTVKRGFTALRACKWINSFQKNKHAPIRVWLGSPLKKPLKVFFTMVNEGEQQVSTPSIGEEGSPERPTVNGQGLQSQSMYERVDNVFKWQQGTSQAEKLLLGALTLIVNSDYYDDHYTPKFFPDYGMEHQMHFDRLYHRNVVAIEFNGQQHYSATEWFGVEVVARQKVNDHNKRGVCKANDVKLIEFTIKDFAVEKIQEKLKGLLPLRDLPDTIIRYINNKFEEYLRKCKPISSRLAASTAN